MFLLHDNLVCSFIFQFEDVAVLGVLLFYSEKQWSQPHLLLLNAEFAAEFLAGRHAGALGDKLTRNRPG